MAANVLLVFSEAVNNLACVQTPYLNFPMLFLFQFVNFAIYMGSSFKLSQNFWCHITTTLYKLDTSLKRTVGVSPDAVRLGES